MHRNTKGVSIDSYKSYSPSQGVFQIWNQEKKISLVQVRQEQGWVDNCKGVETNEKGAS